MLNVAFAERPGPEFKVLCLGAHSDDIEIGCGGTLLKLLEEVPSVDVHWVVVGATGRRAEEAAESAKRTLANAQRTKVVVKGFKDGFFPHIGADIKEFFEELKSECNPDLVLTHYRNDLHQDHRAISELTWNTFRNHLILEYEIVKYDGDFGAPNFFVPLSDDIARKKVRNILECFGSQRDKAWFTDDAFLAILRLRGIECNAPEKFAEAFYCRKIVYR